MFILLFSLALIDDSTSIEHSGCDLCFADYCLNRNRCPKGVEDIFSSGDVDIDYHSNTIYYIDDKEIKSIDLQNGVTNFIPVAESNQSLVSLAVDHANGDLYYSYSTNPLFRYIPKLNKTIRVFIAYENSTQWPISIWVNHGIVYYKSFSSGLYVRPPAQSEIQKMKGLEHKYIENVVFDDAWDIYISTKDKIYVIQEDDILKKSVNEYLPSDYLIAADKAGDIYFIKNRRIYRQDENELDMIGASVSYPYHFMFDSSNYLLVEELEKSCSHYKPIRRRCSVDETDNYIPRIIIPKL